MEPDNKGFFEQLREDEPKSSAQKEKTKVEDESRKRGLLSTILAAIS